MLVDMDTITVDELIGRLKPSEERINRGGSSTITSLNLMEDELIAKITLRLKIAGGGNTNQQKEASSSGGKSGRGRGHGCGKGVGGNSRGGGNADHGGNKVTGDECRYCRKRRHWARECKKKKRDEQAHAAQVEDDGEAALLVACASIDVNSVVLTATEVHLKEDKLFVQLGDKVGDSNRWILDTGATNHMTGERSAFSELDTKVQGTMRFGDGSIVGIVGRGTVLLQCKNGEHKSLSIVYLIPCLTTSIVSLGQLEEGGYQILLFGGYFKIQDAMGRLMTKVERTPNRLYVLELNIARPVCLVAQGSSVVWKWHARYGHLNIRGLRRLADDNMVSGLPQLD
jgi:hypothetical protein